MKTELSERVGAHAFEVAGLGKAPFRFVGCSENRFPLGDGTTKPGGCCQYCFTGISTECHVESSDGKHFVVGIDCVQKVGDHGIYKAFKNSKEYRQHQKDLRDARSARERAELSALLEAPEVIAKLSAIPHPSQWRAMAGETALDSAKWFLEHAGASGRHETLRRVKKLL